MKRINTLCWQIAWGLDVDAGCTYNKRCKLSGLEIIIFSFSPCIYSSLLLYECILMKFPTNRQR
jgi:hypothetical protein